MQTKHLDENEVSSQGKRDELQKEMDKLVQRKDLLTSKQNRLQKQRTVLDGFADNVIKGPIKTNVSTNNIGDNSSADVVCRPATSVSMKRPFSQWWDSLRCLTSKRLAWMTPCMCSI